MIKAIIFDYFGVIVSEGLRAYIREFFTGRPDERAKAQQLTDDFNRGTKNITYDDFVEGLAALAGTTKEVTYKKLDCDFPNTKLLAFITEVLKPRYKIGLLSNAGEKWIYETLSKPDLKLFDKIVLSCELKMIKPDPQIYNYTAKQLGVTPEECVYVDDIKRYCDGAVTVGMEAICFENVDQFMDEVKDRLKSD